VAKLTLVFAKHHSMKLLGLHQVDGCLEVMISEMSGPSEVYLAWIAQIQGSVYPVRTRPLKRRDVRIVEDILDDEDVHPGDEDAIET